MIIEPDSDLTGLFRARVLCVEYYLTTLLPFLSENSYLSSYASIESDRTRTKSHSTKVTETKYEFESMRTARTVSQSFYGVGAGRSCGRASECGCRTPPDKWRAGGRWRLAAGPRRAGVVSNACVFHPRPVWLTSLEIRRGQVRPRPRYPHTARSNLKRTFRAPVLYISLDVFLTYASF